MTIDCIPSRLLENAKTNPAAPAYYEKRGGQWVCTNFGDYAQHTRDAAKGLLALGLKAGGAVCILGFNRSEWSIMDVAAMMAGGVAAGIYTTCSATEVQYIVNHAEALVVLIENKLQWEKIQAERDNLPLLKHVVLMADSEPIEDPMVMTWNDFMEKGRAVSDADLDARMDSIKSEDLATLIYTSGTTGPPKGVMLSHENLAWTATSAVQVTSSSPVDYSLSYLPLCHIAEQMFTIHAPITAGYSVYYAESMEELANNLKEVQPTVFFGVPRVYEKFYAGVSAKLAGAEGVKAKLVAWAQGVGRTVVDIENSGGTPGFFLGLKYKLASRLVFKKLHEAVGMGNARLLVTGAAPINPDIQRFFAGFDLVIREVYGQSEDCGPTTFNVPGRTRFGTVGPAFPGVQVRIADDGEILVKGPNVFMGYYKEEEATAAALADEWLYSGDLGAFDDDGYLTITGRKKDIIITAGGKNIAPKNIEAALQSIPLVSQAVVIGDRRKFLSALVTLDPVASESHGAFDAANADGFHGDANVLAEIQTGVDGVNAQFARVEHIRKFTVLPREFTVEDGELTPTLKIKRRIVNANWDDAIESMYAG